MEEYGFFLSFNNAQQVIRLPVNPETLEVKQAGEGKTHTIIDFGEINAINFPKLRELTIESMFPSRWYPFVAFPEGESDLLPPLEYIQTIQQWMNSRRPIRLVVSGVQRTIRQAPQLLRAEPPDEAYTNDFAINMAVSIENFGWKKSAGTSGDVEYTLSLKEYRFFRAQPVTKKDGGGSGGAKLTGAAAKRPNEQAPPAAYTMRAGDTLWSIARKQLGDGSRYPEIQKLNGIKDSELKRLPVGKVLKLPKGG